MRMGCALVLSERLALPTVNRATEEKAAGGASRTRTHRDARRNAPALAAARPSDHVTRADIYGDEVGRLELMDNPR